MSTQITKLEAPELTLLETSKAEQIKKTFEPMAEMLESFEIKFNEVLSESQKEITKEITEKAKRLRLDIAKVRIETGKLKDKQKEYIKLEDRAIMGVHNILVWAVKEKEDTLKEIENYFEIQEQKRLEALQLQRAELLSKYVIDAHERMLSDMDEEVFNAYLTAKKKEYEDRIEAEKKAELDRIEKERLEAEERERIRKENEKLKAEAIEREKQAKIEQDLRDKAEKERLAKEESERKAREEKERKEREIYEAELKAERDRVAKIQAEEKAKRDKLESELKAKEESERKARELEQQRIEAELLKRDSDKINDLINDLSNLKTKYSFKSEKNQKKYIDVGVLLDKIIDYIKK